MASNARALALYRAVLGAHKKHLPPAMRSLGDTYVKSEFRLHKSAKPELAAQFLDEWTNYLDQILLTSRAQESSLTAGSLEDKGERLFSFGADLPPDVELSEEQMAQLEKLRDEARKAGR